MTEINAATLIERDDMLILDVRTPGEFASQRAPEAVNVPLDRLQAEPGKVAEQLDGPVAIMCASGRRAEAAREALAACGYEHAVVVDGGMGAWQAAGGEVVSERSVWPIERQVRFAAGSLVVIGVLASLVWPPAIALSGFVGAGLVFAAVTDTCGMAMLLAKMPWNRGSSCDVDPATALADAQPTRR
jgi:rhodanese-related sulfurtransferase